VNQVFKLSVPNREEIKIVVQIHVEEAKGTTRKRKAKTRKPITYTAERNYGTK